MDHDCKHQCSAARVGARSQCSSHVKLVHLDGRCWSPSHSRSHPGGLPSLRSKFANMSAATALRSVYVTTTRLRSRHCSFFAKRVQHQKKPRVHRALSHERHWRGLHHRRFVNKDLIGKSPSETHTIAKYQRSVQIFQTVFTTSVNHVDGLHRTTNTKMTGSHATQSI